MKPILVTGAAGFIGFHLASRLLSENRAVIGLDNLNDYYDVNLKKARLALLEKNPNFRFEHMDIAHRESLERLFKEGAFETVLHMAAQAGVRYSIENPDAYTHSNLLGFANILECSRHYGVRHLVYASSSSVYGGNTKLPFSEEYPVDKPISFYAATKRANELMAYTYAHLYGLASTGLRFFTVYGPWGRPDMAPFLFTKAILEGRPIDVFNHGDMQRDFTYIDDVVEMTLRIVRKPLPDTNIYNIGGNGPVDLMHFIEMLEKSIGKKVKKNFLAMQSGDVRATFADTSRLERDYGLAPKTPLKKGVHHFVSWYKEYCQL